MSSVPPASPAPANRNQALDFLRGVAILIVVLHHVEEFSIPNLPEFHGWFGFLFWRFRLFGASGVDLFFVLSGFLVGGLLIHEITKRGSIHVPRFFLRRGFKIWPSYYLLLIVLAVTGATGWLDMTSVDSALRSLAVHGLFLQNYLDQGHNTPTWTLAIEEHFYLLLPLVILALHRVKALRHLGIAAVVAMGLGLSFRLLHMALGHRDNDFMLTHNRFDGLFFGVFLAWLWKQHPERIKEFTRHRLLVFLAVLALISPAFVFARKDAVMFTVGFPMLTLGYGLLLITAVAQGFGWVQTSLLGRGVSRVGLWSYNIYLWHFFLPLVLAPVYLPMQTWLSTAVPSREGGVALQVAFYLGLSIFSGWFFTKFVEEPFLRLREKVVPSRTAIPAGKAGESAKAGGAVVVAEPQVA